MICDFRLQIAELNPCLWQAGEIRIPKSELELNISLSIRIVKNF
jgi:hypothetical protein